ncbi:MAG: glutathione S-transferase N-terminal domain-containing protein [Gammaproteobacteria bacterium]|nr:glutathione S-transferase N-terminal domain-containing protein [Gammaproteobacteria bacterium]
MKFYCAWYCPFAQRAWMTLLHKALPFDYIEVDPYRESSWWLRISRGRALVPVIVQPDTAGRGETTVIDSTRIVEYLDELAPGSPPLLPGDANARAELRFWLDHVNERIVPYMYRFLKAADAGTERDASRDALVDGLQAFGEAISPSGRYFSGTDLTAVDIIMAPFAYRIDVLLDHYRGFAPPTRGEAWAKYRDWYAAACELDIFRRTSTDLPDYRERLIEHYRPYSDGGRQADLTQTD